jgi:hypothetical protein
MRRFRRCAAPADRHRQFIWPPKICRQRRHLPLHGRRRHLEAHIRERRCLRLHTCSLCEEHPHPLALRHRDRSNQLRSCCLHHRLWRLGDLRPDRRRSRPAHALEHPRYPASKRPWLSNWTAPPRALILSPPLATMAASFTGTWTIRRPKALPRRRAWATPQGSPPHPCAPSHCPRWQQRSAQARRKHRLLSRCRPHLEAHPAAPHSRRAALDRLPSLPTAASGIWTPEREAASFDSGPGRNLDCRARTAQGASRHRRPFRPEDVLR